MILIDPDASFPRAALPKRELSRFLADACERIGLPGEVTVLLTTDTQVQDLNRTYRRKNKPTDVLSFPAAPPVFAGGELASGDLAISIDTARRQGEALGHTLKLEVQILILHGLLHLAAFDHETDEGQMARRESKLRRLYDLPAGLIQRAEQDSEPPRRSVAGARKAALPAKPLAGTLMASGRKPNSADAARNPSKREKVVRRRPAEARA